VTTPDLPRTLTFRDLLLFKLVAIVNLSLLTPSAGLGRPALWLWPWRSRCSSSRSRGRSGALEAVSRGRRPYTWANRQFGPTHGFISGWYYWTGNLFYFPMQLVYLAGVIAYAARGRTATWSTTRRSWHWWPSAGSPW